MLIIGEILAVMYFLSLAASVTCRAMQFRTILLLSILNSAYFISYFNSQYTSILPTLILHTSSLHTLQFCLLLILFTIPHICTVHNFFLL